MIPFTTRSTRLLLALASAALMAACGGGGGGEASSFESVEPPVFAPGADPADPADITTPGGDLADSADITEPNADPAEASGPDATVPGHGDRSLALAWAAPLTNDDGTPLTDLAGYRIYYGSRSGSYGHSVAVDDPAALSHRLESLAPGTYYVVVKAVNSAGAQSIASPEVSKTIQ